MPASPLFCSQKPSWSFAHWQPHGNKGGWWINSHQCLPLQGMGLPLPFPSPRDKATLWHPLPCCPPIAITPCDVYFLWMVFDS